MKGKKWTALLYLFLILTASLVQARADYDPTSQTPALMLNEAQTVYLGNLARRQNGVGPMRWNLEMTHAARWYSWDSTENRPPGFCGHQDTLGEWPSDRVVKFGYQGYGGAENAFCGYLSPQSAIDGWMNSPGHRANLLDANSREVGLGYYRRDSDGRGYVTQDFGHDPVFPPLIIDNEAVNTADAQVELYIYDREAGGGFQELGPATQIQISNDPCFPGAGWQPYQTETSWTLAPGQGWRSVYLRTRDALGRTSTVSDTIYLGPIPPAAELSSAQLSRSSPSVTLYDLDGGTLPQAQFSLEWLVDDTNANFSLLWGNGERVNDPDAWGESAFRLEAPTTGPEPSAWVWTTQFIRDVPLVAYLRLKVDDNSSSQEVARFSATGAAATLTINGHDFAAAGVYQEFALPFTWPSGEDFLIFQFWGRPPSDVYVDAVSIFTAGASVASSHTWQVPGGNYRGQGVKVRYTDGGQEFSQMSDAATQQSSLSLSQDTMSFLAVQGGSPPPAGFIRVVSGCGAAGWSVTDSASWLQTLVQGDQIRLTVVPAGLSSGDYNGTVTITPDDSSLAKLTLTVQLRVVDQLFAVYLPLFGR